MFGSVPAKLRDIAADPKISKLFGKMAGDWRAEVEKTARAIEAGKKPKPVKSDAISFKALSRRKLGSKCAVLRMRALRQKDHRTPIDERAKLAPLRSRRAEIQRT